MSVVLIPNGMAAEMTGKKGNRYTFRIGTDTCSQAAAGAEWATNNLGNEWTFVFADYGWGWSHFNEQRTLPTTGRSALFRAPEGRVGAAGRARWRRMTGR